MNRLQEIEKRLAELNGLVETETDTEKLAAYEKEVRSLIQEKGEILGEQRAQARAAARAAFNDPANVVTPDVKPDDEEAQARKWIADADVRSGKGAHIEARSVLVSSGNLATPTDVTKEISEQMSKVSALLNKILIKDKTGYGEHKVPYVATESAAIVGTEGSAPSNDGAGFSYVVIKPTLLVCVDYVSKLIPGESPVAYRNEVQALALKAIRKKALDVVVNGVTDSGSLVNFGILNGANKAGSAMYQTLTLSAAIGAATLRNIALNYGSDDTIDGVATLVLTKAQLQLFGAVRGTNEKKAVYEIEYNPGSVTEGFIIDGGLRVPFILCSKLPSGKMAYGILTNYELDLFGPMKVEIDGSYKFAEGLDTIRAEANVGGNIIVPNGICVITQHSTGAGTTESPTVYD